MATTRNNYVGNGSTYLYSFTFPYLSIGDIKVTLDGVLQTRLTEYSIANATQVSFVTTPPNGAKISIYRETADDDLAAVFYPGSAIRAKDLNDNFTQNLYVTQESGRTAGDSTVTSDEALQIANDAAASASSAVAVANSANINSQDAEAKADSAVQTSAQALVTSQAAEDKSDQAVATANASDLTSAQAVTTAQNAVA